MNELTTKLIHPSVQDVIDRLAATESKTVPFEIDMLGDDGINLDYSSMEIVELVNLDGEPSCVCINVELTGQVNQTFETGDKESDARDIEYMGKMMKLTPYEDKHRPENQKLVQGIPVNPTLRAGFDMTPNDEREDIETLDWWGRPFINVATWVEMIDIYQNYLDRVSVMADFKQLSRKEFDMEQDKRRLKWFESWPSGIRYEVRCLDGGAWDRSTSCGMFDNLEDAIDRSKQLQVVHATKSLGEEDTSD